METSKFEQIKKSIIAFGKKHKACVDEFQKVLESENMKDLCDVIKYNFDWCTKNYKDFSEIILKYKEEFSEQEIYYNESVSKGYMVCCHGQGLGKCHGRGLG